MSDHCFLDDEEPIYVTSLDAFCAGIEEEFETAKKVRSFKKANARASLSQKTLPQDVPITTIGKIPDDGRAAYIYIAQDGGKLLKVGMTTEPKAREEKLKVRIVRVFEVPAKFAKSIETETLRICGNRKNDGEWTSRTYVEVKAAVLLAMKRHGLSLDVEGLIS